jgi:hypothetical protein
MIPSAYDMYGRDDLVGKPDAKRCRWEHNIKMDLKINRMGGCGPDSSGLRQAQVAGSYEHESFWFHKMQAIS